MNPRHRQTAERTVAKTSLVAAWLDGLREINPPVRRRRRRDGVRHLQPIIRYDIGDRVSLQAGPCACGSALPMPSVQGRRDDTLQLGSRPRRTVQVLPLALSTVLEDDAGLFDFQVFRRGPRELSLSTVAHGTAATAVLRRARTVLDAFLKLQGAPDICIRCYRGQASHRGRSGKLQRIVGS